MLIENASPEQVIAFRARRLELPGVFHQEVPSRRYPASDMAAHVFGYVSEVTEPQLQRTEYQGVEPGSIVGQAGVELAYNKQLMGVDGNKTVVVNSVGREVGELDVHAPKIGGSMQLTIDGDVQKSIEDVFAASGFNGAAVVLDPRNGEVLGFSSRPSYDPNAFAAGIDRAAWAALNGDSLKPLQNRALQGRYSPGSTFKMAVGLAGLEEGVITPSFQVHCGGGATFYGRHFACWKKGGHGTVNLKNADRAVVRRLLLHRRQHARRRPHQQVGDALRPRREIQHRSAERDPGPGAVDRVEGETQKEKKWYAGETISVSIGQGAGRGDAGVAGDAERAGVAVDRR